ncbi:hypothetical protein H4Q26_014183 [Puccinia striiformis f. sp. tritici PST-130]|nr:hypothetical protein H4Q26_014183 [Puccinia striiformis f. sp. tritici PST-130]
MSLVGGRTNRPSKASGVPQRLQLTGVKPIMRSADLSRNLQIQSQTLFLFLGHLVNILLWILTLGEHTHPNWASIMFHATLRYEWQLGDELPMIFSGALGVYIAFDTCSSNQQRTRFVRCLPYLLSMYAFGVTAVYLWYPNPVFHQIAFAAISFSWGNLSRAEEQNRWNTIYIWRNNNFLAGFLIWNIDNAYCDQISQLKEYLGAPCAYLGSVGGQLITLSLKEGAEGFEIRRGGIFGLCPYVARTSSRVPTKLQ